MTKAKYLVCYDIETRTESGKRRLERCGKGCQAFGVRVQDSVFECELDRRRRARLEKMLLALIEPGLDSVRIYRLPAKPTPHILGIDLSRPLVPSNW